MTWPVNTRERARELIACGVDGLISDRPGSAPSPRRPRRGGVALVDARHGARQPRAGRPATHPRRARSSISRTSASAPRAGATSSARPIPTGRVPLLGIAGAYAAGVALNSFMPARGGDVAKIALVRTRIPGSSVPTIASSMGVVSLFDAVVGAVAIGLLTAFGVLPSPPGLPQLPAGRAARRRPPLRGDPGRRSRSSRHASCSGAVSRRGSLRIWAGLKAGTAILKHAAPVRHRGRPAAALGLGVPDRRRVLPARRRSACRRRSPRPLIVVVVGGLSTLVPTPGGVGTQQLFLAYFLQATASTATLVAFSLGMQATITALNVVIGLTATMLMLRTLRPARGAPRAGPRRPRAVLSPRPAFRRPRDGLGRASLPLELPPRGHSQRGGGGSGGARRRPRRSPGR